MRLHSDTLSAAEICGATDPDVLAILEERPSRSRRHGWEAFLEYVGEREKGDGRKLRAASNEGAKIGTVTATYNEHGRWMARLFEMDPELLIVGVYRYDGREDFHKQTGDKYR